MIILDVVLLLFLSTKGITLFFLILLFNILNPKDKLFSPPVVAIILLVV